MIDLAAAAGVAVHVDPRSAALELAPELEAEEYAVRTLDEARAVYADPPAHAEPLYHMANGIWPRGRVESASLLRYELTALRPGVVGAEWVKTLGHVHDTAADGLGYPEAYEVVAGRALFVLFRTTPPRRLLVDAAPGELFVIPPGWHHLAINAGTGAMVFADVVARAVVPDYTLLRARRGAPLYLGPGGVRRNRNHPAGAVVRVCASELPLPESHGSLAAAFHADRSRLGYLLEPARRRSTWDSLDELFS